MEGLMDRYKQVVTEHLADADLTSEQLDKVLAAMGVVVDLLRREPPF